MPKSKRLRVVRDDKPISVVGTQRWREMVPPALQKPLAKALHAMEENRLGEALIAFGECWNIDPTSRPVVIFGGDAAARGYFARKASAPDDPNLPQYYQMALDLMSAASEWDPGDAVAKHNLGRFLQDAGHDQAAIAHYRHALLLDRTQVETWGNLGTALYQQGHVEEAWRNWREATRLTTDKASGRLSQAYIWLRQGEYEQGWVAYNERWHDLAFSQGYGRGDLGEAKHWTGQPLNKKKARLLVHGEQGLGDHVQFARYVPQLIAQGYTVVGLETRAILKRWMEASLPDVPVFARDVDPLPDYTHHVSTLDLPGLLGTTLETIPPVAAPALLTGKLFEGIRWGWDKNFRVGIAWHGAAGNPADGQRSIPVECLGALADIPNVTWVNLQFGDGDAMAARAWLGQNVVDGTEGCQDVLDTAAVMRGCDLIVTVDTLTAHLAGALGIPAWVLHRFCREWRWLDQGESCPWYPSVRSLTVPAPNDWPSLLKRVRAEIEAKAQ